MGHPLQLVFSDGDGTRRIGVEAWPFTIGRGLLSDLQLKPDLQVSRRHAQLVCEDGTWSVVDLSSRWGTYLNGVRVDKATVRTGDRLQIGANELQIVLGSVT